MTITVTNFTTMRVPRAAITRVGRAFDRYFSSAHSAISLVLVGSSRIKALNAHYRGINKATDVLSFPLAHMPPKSKSVTHGTVLGEVFICPKYLPKKMSKPIGVQYLLTHGILHVLGYDHHTDSQYKKMHAWEVRILNSCS